MRGEARECMPNAMSCQRAHSVGPARACTLTRVGPCGLDVNVRGGESGRVRCVARRVIARLRCRRGGAVSFTRALLLGCVRGGFASSSVPALAVSVSSGVAASIRRGVTAAASFALLPIVSQERTHSARRKAAPQPQPLEESKAKR